MYVIALHISKSITVYYHGHENGLIFWNSYPQDSIKFKSYKKAQVGKAQILSMDTTINPSDVTIYTLSVDLTPFPLTALQTKHKATPVANN